ncbi:hypothetical protein JQ580_17010 [Bradyrhizobium japonicum]|uniref:hypothetical protein n=1 Tax=Bradyrhizobium japonicum TaxID=375 RepID=UPI001BABD499|nr:hypothetical protein [Bradyrhizobium japonicum]MBR0992415.1 hypothetical protein [Bradyrhizobium japonicum]
MTNEAIKALMIFALYGVLEITLFYSSIVKFAKRPARFRIGRGGARDFAGRAAKD